MEGERQDVVNKRGMCRLGIEGERKARRRRRRKVWLEEGPWERGRSKDQLKQPNLQN